MAYFRFVMRLLFTCRLWARNFMLLQSPVIMMGRDLHLSVYMTDYKPSESYNEYLASYLPIICIYVFIYPFRCLFIDFSVF